LNNSQEKLNFLNSFISKKDTDYIYKLKIVYFKLISDIQKMESIKMRILNRGMNRRKYFLKFLWLLLVAQTGIFYHMIYNVDHLGWDLVEPITFLLSSVIYVAGIVSYVKFHRNFSNGQKIGEVISLNLLLKGNVKFNCNEKILLQLKKEAESIKKILDTKIWNKLNKENKKTN